jgi:osmotically-inducible protein OsmY
MKKNLMVLALATGVGAYAFGHSQADRPQPNSSSPAGINRVANDQLARNIENALRHDAKLKQTDAHVRVRDAEVVLVGTAPDRMARERAQSVASWYTDRNVVNQIVVLRRPAF